MGTPTRPSLAPLPVLAAVARANPTLVVGPLVARIGLVGTPHLIEQYTTLHAVAPGRVIATLGSGDKLSAAENVAYDIPARDADERRALMAETARALVPTMPVWFGAGNDTTNRSRATSARSSTSGTPPADASPRWVRAVPCRGPDRCPTTSTRRSTHCATRVRPGPC